MIETADPFARALDVELELVESAIRMVASGAATRVIVSNLAYSRVVLEPALVLATAAGVSVVAEAGPRSGRTNVVAASRRSPPDG